jgi:hypothetical protein
LQQQLETFLARAAPDERLPAFVERELRTFLRCGILAYGFARVHCDGCGHDRLVAFSCKGRGFCPSCGGKRMTGFAEHMVEHVLPIAPVRQWVLTVPHRLRYRMAYDHDVCRAVHRAFARSLQMSYRQRAAAAGISQGATRAVTCIVFDSLLKEIGLEGIAPRELVRGAVDAPAAPATQPHQAAALGTGGAEATSAEE